MFLTLSLKIFPENQHCFIETNKDRSARVNLSELKFLEKKYSYDTRFLEMEENEFIHNLCCFNRLNS